MGNFKEAICPICGRVAGVIYTPKPWKVGIETARTAIKKTDEELPPRTYRAMKEILVDNGDISAELYFAEYIAKQYDLDRDYWGVVRGPELQVVDKLSDPLDEEDKRIFDGLKKCFKLAIAHYLRKGWLTDEDLEEARKLAKGEITKEKFLQGDKK